MSYSTKLVCLVCFLIITFNANSEEKGFYAGGSLGYSRVNAISDSEINSVAAAAGVTVTTSIEDNDLGWKIFAGYNLNQYFGVEFGYVDLGETTGTITVIAPAAGVLNLQTEADGFTLAGLARYPLSEKFDIFGKVVPFLWDRETVLSAGVNTLSLPNRDGTDIMFGLGAEYELENNIGIRAEWERYEVGSDDADLFSVGLEYDF